MDMKSKAIVAVMLGVLGMFSHNVSAQSITKGPILNPANKHRYTMIQATSWEQARTWARARGGDLVTIDDAAENTWVFNTFSPGGIKYMIGMSATDVTGTLTWSDGSTSAYRNWAAGEPNINGTSKYVTVQSDLKWYIRVGNFSPYYVVETSGPIKVPQQYPTVDSAFMAMNDLSFYDLEVGPGFYVVSQTYSLSTNGAAPRGVIRGAGLDQTTIVFGASFSSAPSLILNGLFTVRDISLARSTDNAIMGISNGSLVLDTVMLDGTGVNGNTPLMQLNFAGAVAAVRSTFKGARYALSYSSSDSPLINVNNCVFTNINVVTSVSVNGIFSNCTFNTVGQNATSLFGGQTFLTNCIVWNLTGSLGGRVTALANNVQGGVQPGEGNISVDPKFLAGSLRLSADSPCIDAGSATMMLGAAVDFEGLSRISGTGPDMGAYEVQQAPPPTCGADFNADGFVTFEDFDDFVAAFEAGC